MMANILLSIKFMYLVAPLSLHFSHKSRHISHPVAIILPFLQHKRSPGKHLLLHPHSCLCAQTPQQSVVPHTQVHLLSRRKALHKLHLSQKTLHHIYKCTILLPTKQRQNNRVNRNKPYYKLINVLRKFFLQSCVHILDKRKRN